MHSTGQASCVELERRLRSSTRHFSLQEVHQKPSCLIPFAVMGVALVFLLFVCKLTVARETISGLVFYANIVGPNRTIFLPVESTDVFSLHG